MDPESTPLHSPAGTRDAAAAGRAGRGRFAVLAGAVLLLILLALGAWWLSRAPAPQPAVAPPEQRVVHGRVEPMPAARPAVDPASTAPASAPPAIQAPLTPASDALRPEQIEGAVQQLLGRKTVLRMLQLDDFSHRLVATVDNLGRRHAPSRLWPVHPTPGRFKVQPQGAELVGIHVDNAERYTPFVLMLERVDPAAAVALYRRLYPLLQQAYEELGFPGQSFHARLIEVIDLMLATPAAESGLRLRLTEVKGEVASTRPWVRYEFADPALESLAAGQKLMLRVGPVHQRRLAKLLQSWRAELLRR